MPLTVLALLPKLPLPLRLPSPHPPQFAYPSRPVFSLCLPHRKPPLNPQLPPSSKISVHLPPNTCFLLLPPTFFAHGFSSAWSSSLLGLASVLRCTNPLLHSPIAAPLSQLSPELLQSRAWASDGAQGRPSDLLSPGSFRSPTAPAGCNVQWLPVRWGPLGRGQDRDLSPDPAHLLCDLRQAPSLPWASVLSSVRPQAWIRRTVGRVPQAAGLSSPC